MNNKKFIGGGFPGIKECIDEKNILTKESREKREFSVRKIIPINLILSKNKNITNNAREESEQLNLKESIKYNEIDSFLHNSYTGQVVESNFDIDMINGPLINSSKKSSKSKRSNKPKKSSKSKK